MKETRAWHKSYDLGDWEGGIAVFVTKSDHGAKIISIPRLGLSASIVGNEHITIPNMLLQNRTMYNNPKEMDLFSNLIIRDIQHLN
jgi:hypothetical protein